MRQYRLVGDRELRDLVRDLEAKFERIWSSPYATGTPDLTAALRGSPGKRRRRRAQPKARQETLF
jgi:hypothetical protein